MPLYKYRAIDSGGKSVADALQADTQRSAVDAVYRMGLTPITVARDVSSEKKSLLSSTRMSSKGSEKKIKVKHTTIVVFSRQLATLIRAAVPILNGLTILHQQTDDDNLKVVLSKLKFEIGEGISLSHAMAKFPRVFSELYVSMVSAGEVGGVLDVTFDRLAGFLEHEARTKAAIKSASRYPMIVVIAITCAFFGLVTFVIPKFSALFASSGVLLPLPTRIMMGINYGIRNYWFYIVPSMLAVAFLFKRLIATDKGKLWWDGLRLQIPVFGPLTLHISMARFAQMLSTLDRAGLPILRTLDIISNTIGNKAISKELESVKKNVRDGQSISDPLVKSDLFPALVSQMIAVGESTGRMGELLDALQQYYDEEANNRITNLTSLIEPMLTVGLGFIVLTLALAIFMPMWELMSVFRAG